MSAYEIGMIALSLCFAVAGWHHGYARGWARGFDQCRGIMEKTRMPWDGDV